MPVKDRYHDIAVRTLVNEGWTIAKEQFYVNFPQRRLWIDIRAVKEVENRVILVEVKSFENVLSPIDYLASAVGKYVMYRLALEQMGIETPLYLAVPVAAHDGILKEPIGQLLIQQLGIRLMIFDYQKVEIVRWIP